MFYLQYSFFKKQNVSIIKIIMNNIRTKVFRRVRLIFKIKLQVLIPNKLGTKWIK